MMYNPSLAPPMPPVIPAKMYNPSLAPPMPLIVPAEPYQNPALASPGPVSMRSEDLSGRQILVTGTVGDVLKIVHQILLKKMTQRNLLAQTEQSPFPQTTQNISNVLLRKVEFGKSEPPVSDVHDIKRLTTLGDSVCRLVIGNQVMGTGFVLYNKLILTNAHLFRNIALTFEEDGVWTADVPVLAQFYYEDRTLRQLPISFEVDVIADIDFEMDYAVLELKEKPGEIVPPGLLKHVGPKPKSGFICIIGHPGGDVKKMDFTSIIGKYERLESANRKLLPYDDLTKRLITAQVYERPDVDQIFSSDQVITYDTFMFHGSSGSPVFDSECRVVGLHSDGFSYGFNQPKNLSIVEFGRPILDIFKKFVVNMAVRHTQIPLEDFKNVAQGNLELIRILQETGLWIE